MQKVMVDEHWEGQLSCGGPPRGAKGPAPQQETVAQGPVPGRGVPTASSCENHWELQPFRQDRRQLEMHMST